MPGLTPKLIQRLEAVYKRLPKIECQRKCQEACGPIVMSDAEWQRIIEWFGYRPDGDASLTCPMLNRSTGACNCYEIRPLICRLFGIARGLRCPFGCVPKQWLTDDEAGKLIAEIQEIGELK